MGCGTRPGGRTEASAPTEMSEHLRRAACPHAAVMVRWLTGGGLRAARPTEAQQKVQWAGDRKGRPYESVTRGAVKRGVEDAAPYGGATRSAVGRDDVGSELSAAGGRGSEVSEWPRSKFPASAVRQRRNFGHRNRVIVPYGGLQEVRGRNPPVTAAPCQPPLGKGAGTGERIATGAKRPRNDRGLHGVRYRDAKTGEPIYSPVFYHVLF